MADTFNPAVQEFLRALASETRQRILLLFTANGELTVGQVAAAAGVGQSTASEQLSLLKRAGLLTATREGKEVFYRPNHAQLVGYAQELLDYLRDCAEAQPC